MEKMDDAQAVQCQPCIRGEGDEVRAMVNEIRNWGSGSWTDGLVDNIKIVLRNSLGRGLVLLTTD